MKNEDSDQVHGTELECVEMERARLATAIEQAAEAVVITDAHGAISYVNPAFESTTGYSRAEVIGLNPRLLKSGTQDAAFYHALWATIRGGSTWRGRLANKKKNGTLYTEDASISPVRDASGTITSYVAVKRDITATLALEAQLRLEHRGGPGSGRAGRHEPGGQCPRRHAPRRPPDDRDDQHRAGRGLLERSR